MNLNKFFAELRRRNVYKVGIAYAVVPGLVIQIATEVFPVFRNSELTVLLGVDNLSHKFKLVIEPARRLAAVIG